MTTCWKGNCINFSIELYFGICSILDAGENLRRRGKDQHDENKMKGDKDDNNEEELGLWFHQAYMIEFRSSGQNKGPTDVGKGRHE